MKRLLLFILFLLIIGIIFVLPKMIPEKKSAKFKEVARIVGVDTLEGFSSLTTGTPPKIVIQIDFDDDNIEDVRSVYDVSQTPDHVKNAIEWYEHTRILPEHYQYPCIVKVSATRNSDLVVITDHAEILTDIDGNYVGYTF